MSILTIKVTESNGNTLCTECQKPAKQLLNLRFTHTGVSTNHDFAFCTGHLVVRVDVEKTIKESVQL